MVSNFLEKLQIEKKIKIFWSIWNFFNYFIFIIIGIVISNHLMYPNTR